MVLEPEQTVDINSINNTFISTATQTNPDASEVKQAGADRNGDTNDRSLVQSASPSIGPSFNANGQKIGQVINVKA